MSDNSSIEWTDATWNVVIGCDRVSPGCGMPRFDGDDPGGCYAITQAHIRAANPHPKVAAAFTGLTERAENGVDWTGKVNLLPDRLDQPLRWRNPKRIFVNSLGDLFHKDVPEDFIARVWTVMAATPQHTYQILTKRHARMRSIVRRIAWRTPTTEERQRGVHGSVAYAQPNEKLNDHLGAPRVLPNVWLGVSVEDQKRADLRIPALLDTPAAVRWISAEPLLGPVDLAEWLGPRCRASRAQADRPFLDWVVTGGESGPGARPPHPDWFRQLRDQCNESDVAYLLKQWGAWAPTGAKGIGRSPKGHALVGDPVDEQGHRIEMARVGKKAAGRLLDGRTWDQYPASATA